MAKALEPRFEAITVVYMILGGQLRSAKKLIEEICEAEVEGYLSANEDLKQAYGQHTQRQTLALRHYHDDGLEEGRPGFPVLRSIGEMLSRRFGKRVSAWDVCNQLDALINSNPAATKTFPAPAPLNPS